MLGFDTNEQALAHRFAALLIPHDATECGAWGWRGQDDWRRGFLTREWDVGGIWVSVAGEQDHHGTIRRWVHVGGEDRCTGSDRGRLIAALFDAGRLFDSLQSDRSP